MKFTQKKGNKLSNPFWYFTNLLTGEKKSFSVKTGGFGSFEAGQAFLKRRIGVRLS